MGEEVQEAYWVWPGTIIDVQHERIVLTLTRVTGESFDEYVYRCENILSYAAKCAPSSKPDIVFDEFDEDSET